MRAVVIHAAHDLRIEERDVADPGPAEVRVRIRRGGICGSDLHYYHDGGFGTVRIREPMILGHEVSGVVDAIGRDVAGVKPGDKVAVNPSLPCDRCRYCLEGRSNHCMDMRFYGSAMRFPHVQGGFRDLLLCEERQCVPVPRDVDLSLAAFAEPFSVCLHAVKQAGDLLGRRVLITGCGPIGSLTVVAARRAGALEIVVTDVIDTPLRLARELGADRAINVATDSDALTLYSNEKGAFDVVIEASGNARALLNALDVARPGATIVQLGIGGDASLPISKIVAKEISLKGSFRFHEEFAWAVRLLTTAAVRVDPLLTAIVPVTDAVRAFDLAGDRSQAMKVQLAFES